MENHYLDFCGKNLNRQRKTLMKHLEIGETINGIKAIKKGDHKKKLSLTFLYMMAKETTSISYKECKLVGKRNSKTSCLLLENIKNGKRRTQVFKNCRQKVIF